MRVCMMRCTALYHNNNNYSRALDEGCEAMDLIYLLTVVHLLYKQAQGDASIVR